VECTNLATTLITDEVKRIAHAVQDAIDRQFMVLAVEPCAKNPYYRYSPHGVDSATRELDKALAPYSDNIPANYGVACGASGLSIVDVDYGVKSLEELTQWMFKNNLPETFTVQSGRDGADLGFHLYYLNSRDSRSFTLDGVTGEIKSNGGYVVGSGSRHSSGRLYTIVKDIPLAAFPEAAFPEKQYESQGTLEPGLPVGSPVPANQRNPRLTKLAGTLRNQHLDEDTIFAALRNFAINQCEDGENYFAAEEEKLRDLAHRAVTKFDAAPLPTLITVGGIPTNPTDDEMRAIFHTKFEYENAKPIVFAILNWLQEDAVTFIGGLSGHAKTLILMAMCRALLTGEPLFNHPLFTVPVKAERVVYLIPESTLTPFKLRMKLFGLEKFFYADKFLFRTLSSESDVELTDPRILKATKGAHVFLDTAVRFMDGEEVIDSKKFAETVFRILKTGAKSVTAAHHSSKDFAKATYMSLENILRGSGDIGALCATVWGVKQTDKNLNQVVVQNCKPRDFQPCEPFVLQGRPFIDDTGTFQVIATDVVSDGKATTFSSLKWTQSMLDALETYEPDKRKKVEQVVNDHNKNVSNKNIAAKLDVSHQTVANWLKDFNQLVKDFETHKA